MLEAYVGTVIRFTSVAMLLVRPGKPDLLFCTSHLLDLRAGGHVGVDQRYVVVQE